ncbi:MAG TPA: DUF177 domain-containing protein [Stellaceae bacterium]|nr:DUF177 domain-containing protein [Stellaceae bacterium]
MMTPEFSRPLDTVRLGPEDWVRDLAASPAEREALARRFGLLALPRLEARVTLHRRADGAVRLSAALRAEVVQECVVSLKPVANRIEESFVLIFAEEEEGRDLLIDEDADPIDSLGNGVIDLGEAVAQQLSLALDPYPRSPA